MIKGSSDTNVEVILFIDKHFSNLYYIDLIFDNVF